MGYTKANDLIRLMATALNGLLNVLDVAAAEEKSPEARKALRKITAQARVKAARGLIGEADAFLCDEATQ